LREYGEYQGKSFRDAVGDDSRRVEKKKLKSRSPKPPVKMAIFTDLLTEQKFRDHLTELQKLPPFMRVCSVQNFLSFCGLSLNKVQVVLNIPHCRILPTQYSFARLSLNVGPGDYEWFVGKFQNGSNFKILFALCPGFTP